MKFIPYYVKTGLQDYSKPTSEFWQTITCDLFPDTEISYIDYVKQSKKVHSLAISHGYTFKLLAQSIDDINNIDSIKKNILKQNNFIIFVNNIEDELDLYNTKNLIDAKIHDLKMEFTIKYDRLVKYVEYLGETLDSSIHYSHGLGESINTLIEINNLEKKSENKKESVIYKNIISPILKINTLNLNNRNYTDEIVSNIISQYNKKKEEFGVFFGEFGYPSSFDITLPKVSHNVIALYISSGILYGVIDILDTDKGKELVEMLEIEDYILAPRLSGHDPLDNDLKLFSFDIIKKSESSYYNILEGSIKI